MRSYRQYCGLARALDLVGDRWTLLIVRELLIRGSARYGDLLQGLPGIATNLLADRLTTMAAHGLIEREDLPPPASGSAFRLTPRGQELETVVRAFGHWAAPLMVEPRRTDAVQGHWLVLPARFYLEDRTPTAPPVAIQLELPDGPVLLRTSGYGPVSAKPGRAAAPDTTLEGEPHLVMGLLTGRLSVREARKRGLRIRGSYPAFERIRPRAPTGNASSERR